MGWIIAVGLLSSPLASIRTVIKTKNTSPMPFGLSMAAFCNSLCWYIYGHWILDDRTLWVPNGIGALTSFLALRALHEVNTVRNGGHGRGAGVLTTSVQMSMYAVYGMPAAEGVEHVVKKESVV